MQRIALTGAQGFVGAHLKAQLRQAGYTVVPLARTAPAGEPDWIRFSLEDGLEAALLRGFDALIHCAYDFRPAGADESRRRNVDGSMRLFRSAQEAGVQKLVFVSTFSAFPGCKSIYGKQKLAVEQAVAALGGIIVRLGFVYDGTERGLSGRLQRLASTLPVIPLPGDGSQKLYPVSALDLGPSMLRIMKCATPGAVIPLAQVQPVTFSHLLRAYGKRAAKPPRLLPAPWQPAWMVLRCLELGGVRLSFRSDSLLSLVNQNPDPDFSATHGLGLALRTFPGEETPRQWGVET